MSKNFSPSLKISQSEEHDFDPSKINVFLDIAEYDIIPKLTKYISLNGGKSSPFLDISVTHVVTDKAKTMIEIYHMTQKWNFKVWTVEEFASHLLSYMYSKGTKVNSPTLLKLTTIKRDLSQCLQEEKRQSKPSKTSTTTQFAPTRTNNETNNSISFVPFEAFYVIIEDADGLHCPIFKEYPMQLNKDESSAHFKVPRLPYPIFYWESPVGQCPFIPPLVNDSNQTTRKSSQAAVGQAVEKGKIPINPAAATVTPVVHDLRARALRNSTAAKQLASTATGPTANSAPKFVFEPAMTDTSILTAKTNLSKHHTRHHPHPHAHLVQGQVQNNSTHPILKITPNISVNVNRATVSATTPKQAAFTGNLRKLSPTAATVVVDENGQQSQVSKKQREKQSTSAAVHRARPGYCECCCEKYSELEKHVKEPIHRQFALQSDNYEGIDNFLIGLKRPLKAEFLYKSSSTANDSQHINDNSLLLESSLIQNSPISPTPTTTTSHVTTARNYTGTKKMKQSLASKRIKMIANTTTSSILDEEDAEASGVMTVLTAGEVNEPVENNENNYISSPSCKRRKPRYCTATSTPLMSLLKHFLRFNRKYSMSPTTHTAPSQDLIKYSEYLVSCLPKYIEKVTISRGNELNVHVPVNGLLPALQFLRDHGQCQYKQLMDMTAVDWIKPNPTADGGSNKGRFELVYCLLSIKHNSRLVLHTYAESSTHPSVPSVTSLYPSADWSEREAFDLFGVIFEGHPDLRRIMTDYGFEGHPLRKDFPLTGFVEVRYDEEVKRVIEEPLELTQEFRKFEYSSPWEQVPKKKEIEFKPEAVESISESSESNKK